MTDIQENPCYSSVIHQILQNILYFKSLLNAHFIDYIEELNEIELKKVISKINSTYTMIPTINNQVLLYTSNDYMIKLYYLYPELRKIKNQLKSNNEKKELFNELQAFLRCPKNEKNAILLNGIKGVFKAIKCLNIEKSFMMFIYDNKDNLYSKCQSLRKFIESNEIYSKGGMNEIEIKQIADKINDVISSMSGFEYLVHGNLSIDNIYIYKNTENGKYEIKVTDFAYSRYLIKKDKVYFKQHLSQFVNELYQSPNYFSSTKVISRKNASKCDLYSLGLILFYLVSGKELFTGIESVSNEDKPMFIQSKIYTALNLLKENGKSKEFIKVIKELLPQSCENSSQYNQINNWVKDKNPELIIYEEHLNNSMLNQKRPRNENIKT